MSAELIAHSLRAELVVLAGHFFNSGFSLCVVKMFCVELHLVFVGLLFLRAVGRHRRRLFCNY